MKYNRTFRSLAAFLLALVLMVMTATVCVCAEDLAAAPDAAGEDALLDAAAPDAAEPDAADTTAADTTAADTTAADTTAADDHDHDHDHDDDKKEEKKLGTFFWVSLGIFGAAILAGVIVAIIKREKLKLWWKSYKSELKKIVWMPWSQVRKNTIVVIVVVVALAAVIGLLDIAFSKGIIALGKLI